MFSRSATRVNVVAAALVGAWVALVGLGVGGDQVAHEVSNIGQILVAAVAGWFCLLAARRDRERQSFWRLLGCASLAFAMGQTIWTGEDAFLANGAPFPSPADVGYISSSLLLVAALASIVRTGGGLVARARALCDGLLMAGSLLLVSWLLVLEVVFHGATSSRFAQATSLACPTLDVVVLTLLYYTQARSRRSASMADVPFGKLSAGVGALAVGDSIFAWVSATGSYTAGSVLLNVGWVIGFALIGVAALDRTRSQPVTRSSTELEHVVTMLAPYAALTIAFCVSLAVFVRSGDRSLFVFLLQSGLVAALMGRQALTLLESRAIAGSLEDRVRVRTHEVAASERRFRALVLHSSDVTTVIDPGGLVLYQSDSVQRVFGYRPEDIVGSRIASIIEPCDEERVLETIARAIGAPQQPLEVTASLVLPNGSSRDATITVTSLLDDADVRALVLNTRDVTDERALTEQLRHQAFHDPLTSLANRALFRNRLDHALSRRNDTPAQLLYLDLDRFKEINDTLGHGHGDALLVNVAARLRTCVRSEDTIARIGGDEFAILLERDDAGAAESLAIRILEALVEPFPNGEHEPLQVRVSIGVVTADRDADGETLPRDADLAMYRAKADQSGYAVYEPSMHSDLLERLTIARELPGAIERGELLLEYQPTVSISDSSLIGVEALVRWNHPRLGRLAPGAFVPVAEQNGLMVELGRWVLLEACTQAARWSADHHVRLMMNVNVAAEELRHPDFVQGVFAVLGSTGLAPGQLVLELTESSLVAEFERSVDTLNALRRRGIRIAIDDFGTGYSSLTYIHRLPIDVLKIDRSFIAEIDRDGRNRQIVQAIMTLAQELEIVTIAEGVERAGELDALRDLGCEIVQGYLTGRPMPASAIVGMLDTAELRAA
jgi:diguanylate cyclase (GGDEF)-like protein/PAS domain S-box-containing protein